MDRVMDGRHESTSWNWTHLGLLAMLPPYAWMTQAAGLSDFATLALHLILTLAWLGVAERRWPHRPQWRAEAADLRRDGVFFGANVLADSLGGLLLRGLALWWLAGTGSMGWARALPMWAAVPLALLISELTAYGLHRWSHAGGWLWRVHAVHHRPESLNVFNNFTTHPVNVLLLKLAKLSPLLLLGFDAKAVLFAMLFVQAQSFATHANVRGSMKWLNYLVGTAELHRRHHGVEVDEALNFATAIPLWDQVFGTFRLRTDEPAVVGVATPEHYPGQRDWRGLMLLPLHTA